MTGKANSAPGGQDHLAPRCRSCGAALETALCDLGVHPLCESFLAADELNRMEPHFPLKAWVCESCWLCQLEEYVSPEDIFREYAYFSSYSTAFVDHARTYTTRMTERFGLTADSLAMELASNDGYLLRWFVEAGIPVLGIEPARNVAVQAEEVGVRTVTEFFGNALADKLAADGVQADLIAGNNVYAQVPDINDFVSALPKVLAPAGVVTAEFPHIEPFLDDTLFDTIYHEHFSYFSFTSFEAILARHGLEVFDVEEVWTHGGSLRVFAQHRGGPWPITDAVAARRTREHDRGLDTIEPYREFEARVWAVKRRFLAYLIEANDAGRTVAAYGAPGKGNTLLNFCGIGPDLIRYAVDRNPYKHGRFCPGSRIPIHPVEHLFEDQPDDIVIMPWNLRDEIVKVLEPARAWGARPGQRLKRLEGRLGGLAAVTGLNGHVTCVVLTLVVHRLLRSLLSGSCGFGSGGWPGCGLPTVLRHVRVT